MHCSPALEKGEALKTVRQWLAVALIVSLALYVILPGYPVPLSPHGVVLGLTLMGWLVYSLIVGPLAILRMGWPLILFLLAIFLLPWREGRLDWDWLRPIGLGVLLVWSCMSVFVHTQLSRMLSPVLWILFGSAILSVVQGVSGRATIFVPPWHPGILGTGWVGNAVVHGTFLIGALIGVLSACHTTKRRGLLLMAALVLLALALNSNRSTWIAATIAAPLLFLVQRKMKYALVVALAIVTVLVTVRVIFQLVPLDRLATEQQRKLVANYLVKTDLQHARLDDSIGVRTRAWKVALGLVPRGVLTEPGANTSVEADRSVSQEGDFLVKDRVLDPHNTFMSFFLYSGVIGVTSFLLLLSWTVIPLLHRLLVARRLEMLPAMAIALLSGVLVVALFNDLQFERVLWWSIAICATSRVAILGRGRPVASPV